MVWFICDSCGDSIKKPKVQSHTYQCAAASLTCIDCSRTFDRNSYKTHNTCVTEHQKYAEGATKPGGFAAKGFQDTANGNSTQSAAAAIHPAEDEFLAKRPPWKCSVCDVSCTSLETLQGHASGKKHQRRAAAARGAQSAQNGSSAPATTDNQPANHSAANGATAAAEPIGSGAATHTSAAAPTANGATSAPDIKKGGQADYKWKKWAAAALKANGGVMKLKQLQKSVLQKAGVGDKTLKASVKKEMMTKWRSSSQFQVGDAEVRLKA